MNNQLNTTHFKVGALLAAVYVALGAFGAHGLHDVLSPKDMATYETALRYLIIHSLGLLLIHIVFILLEIMNKWCFIFIYAGLVLFSASLLVHSLRHLIGFEANVFALVAPLGGLSFIAAWLVFIYTLTRK
jgi:uncharacterized membrane protein YgdD (TMEM256/DUF423 family)